MTKLRTWTIAALVCLLIAGLGVNLDGPDDMRHEWDQSEALLDAQREAAQAERLMRAAQAVCAEKRGPHAEARWTEDGKLACVGRRGVKPLMVAGGVL
jgi:hypothetical protein